MSQKTDSTDKSLLGQVAAGLIEDLKRGAGDEQKRRQAEDWLKGLADKQPSLDIATGLREYYLAEAERLRDQFTQADDLGRRLDVGRSIESFLEKAHEIELDQEDSGE